MTQALLTGQSTNFEFSSDYLKQAAESLRQIGVRNVIVTLGEKGAMFVDNTGVKWIPSHSISVVDTTAAGDAFVGAFAFALAEGKSTFEAVNWANAAGALATTKLGAQPSLPTYQSVAEFLKVQRKLMIEVSSRL